MIAQGLVVVDHDVYFYRRIALALQQGDWFQASSTYVPPLFGWLWGICGGSWMAGQALAALGAGLTVLAAVRLASNLNIPEIPIAIMTTFLASLTRYGAQPLPDSLYLALHLYALSECAQRTPNLKRLLPALFFLPWLRFDGLLFIPVYLAWFMGARRHTWKEMLPIAGAFIVSIAVMSVLNLVRIDSWLPTTRFEALYPTIGEDQIVGDSTLWDEWANKGMAAPAWSEDDLLQAKERHIPRESTNANSSTWVNNCAQLLGYSLWDSEHLTPLLLPLALLGMFSVRRRHRALTMMAIVSVCLYGFLGVRERYLQFSEVLWLMLIARGLSVLFPPKVLLGLVTIWVCWQIKVGLYHHRHPEILPLEHRQAGEWIAHQEHSGPVMAREGAAAIYANRTWVRLPTNELPEIESFARRRGVRWAVIGTRTDFAKRPWQKWLQDGTLSSSSSWTLMKLFSVKEGNIAHVAKVYRLD